MIILANNADSNNEQYIIEEKFKVKLPTIWADGKAEVGRVREEKPRSEKKRKNENEEDAGA